MVASLGSIGMEQLIEMELLLSGCVLFETVFFCLFSMIKVDLTVLLPASAKLLYVGRGSHLVVVR